MIFDKEAYVKEFDVAIYGLGYEKRSISGFKEFHQKSNNNIVIGYELNTTEVSYQENKSFYSDFDIEIHEGDCCSIVRKVRDIIKNKVENIDEPRVLLDITVLSRHRMASIIYNLLTDLNCGSKITVYYNLSDYVDPPIGIQPVKEMGPIIDELSGDLGNLSMPTSIVFGLGYEEHKALGVYNYYDADYSYAFIPNNPYTEFEPLVRKNNAPLLDVISERNTFVYDVTDPYSTYVNLKSLLLNLTDVSRTILVPLGPKIFAAIGVILGKELYPKLPVWRVSSLHTEKPVERTAQKDVIFSLTL